jgi:hypothetical protein
MEQEGREAEERLVEVRWRERGGEERRRGRNE